MHSNANLIINFISNLVDNLYRVCEAQWVAIHCPDGEVEHADYLWNYVNNCWSMSSRRCNIGLIVTTQFGRRIEISVRVQHNPDLPELTDYAGCPQTMRWLYNVINDYSIRLYDGDILRLEVDSSRHHDIDVFPHHAHIRNARGERQLVPHDGTFYELISKIKAYM